MMKKSHLLTTAIISAPFLFAAAFAAPDDEVADDLNAEQLTMLQNSTEGEVAQGDADFGADPVEETAEEWRDETEDAADDAWDETEDTAEEGADEVEDALDEPIDETEDAAAEAWDETEDAADEAEDELDEPDRL